MNIAKWFKREAATNPAVQPPARQALVAVTPRQAMNLEAVYRCLFIIETAAKQLTIDAWRGNQPLTPAPSLIRRPNIHQTQTAFIVQTVQSLAQRGNAYWLVTCEPTGEVINLDVLPALEVQPKQDHETGIIDFAYRGRLYNSKQIIHLKLMTVAGEIEGLGPIQAAARSIGGALTLADYASKFTQGIPRGLLTSDQSLTQDQADQLKKEWNEHQSLGNGTAVLGKGTHFEMLYLKPSEMQLLDNQNFNVTQIARLFGIPARLMLAPLEGSSTTYANSQQEDLQLVKWTLTAYLREIEAALTDLLPRGQTARFNLEGLLRADTLTRYQAHQIAIKAGFLTVNEVREIEGLDPLDETPQPQEMEGMSLGNA
ncbi:phage portal protein [uncultured Mobiluncus sp.]|uniref:phage portal protein n=1 Tax=uncultured Mobiluncus sp. TaxID=293425 RepID=UPI00262A196B|nr:phage portal protein [uncultured Mobiluncus sp.]